MDERTRPVSVDDLFDLLGSSRRRFVLRRLAGRSEWVDVEALGRELAAFETRDAAGDGAGLLAVQSLHHVHIPKLADADLVRFDAERNAVRRADSAERLRASLDDAQGVISGLRRVDADGRFADSPVR